MRGRCLVPARDVWPREPRRPPQCPLPPAGAGKGRKRRQVGEGHCPHVRSGPAPHCAGGGTLRGPGLGVPRVVQWSLPSPVPPPPRLQDGGQSRGPSPACSWLRTLASTLSPETRVTRLPAPPFPLGALSPSEITDAGGGGGWWRGHSLADGHVSAKLGNRGDGTNPAVLASAPALYPGNQKVASAGGPHSSGGRGQRGRRASFRRQVTARLHKLGDRRGKAQREGWSPEALGR